MADGLGVLLGQRDRLTPPRWMFADPDRLDGSHDVREFVWIGESTVEWFIQQGLSPADRVLEIGCGIGRMALPLTRHLRGGGSYEGIEIDPEKVAYCRRTIARAFPNFNFTHADVFNKYYNPRGAMRGCDYRFPFGDNSFDFVILVSVFTHMLPADMEHYFSEIARVIKPGAKCSSSYRLAEQPVGAPLHRYSDVCEIADPREPEWGVVYQEPFVRALYDRYGLEIERVYYGPWIDQPGGERKQDVVVAIASHGAAADSAVSNSATSSA